MLDKIINRLVCFVFGHTWGRKTEFHAASGVIVCYSYCIRCGRKYNGGL